MHGDLGTQTITNKNTNNQNQQKTVQKLLNYYTVVRTVKQPDKEMK